LAASDPRTYTMRHTSCALAETLTLVLCYVAAVGLLVALEPKTSYAYAFLLPKALVHALVLQVCLYYNDLYDDRAMRVRLEVFLRFGQAFLIGTVVLAVVYFAIPPLRTGRGVMVIYLPLALTTVLLWRSVYLWASGHQALGETVLILGTGPHAIQIAREMLRRAPLGFRVAGFLGEHRAEVGRRLVNPSVIGTIDGLSQLVDEHQVSLIVVALEDRRGRMPVADLLRCRMRGIRVEEATNFFERLTGRILVKNLRPSWLVFSQGFNKPRFLRNAKQTIEFVMALALLVITAPLLGLLALLIRLESPGPVFYRQERVGQKGKIFSLIKFRTMRADAESATGPVWTSVEGDPRMTRLGGWLRKVRLDELPQLVNVVRGEMSFVGPRPERPHFVETLRKIIPYYDERHSVPPGITGWAQVKFCYGSTIEDAEEKLQFDLYYVKHMSLLFDLGIILDTLKVVVLGRGAR